MNVRSSLGMNRQNVRTRLGERVEKAIDRRDHEMDVERLGGVRAQRLHHHRADRQIGDIMPSITSTWIQSAPAASTARTSSPSRAKSADKMEGAMRT